MAVQKRSKTRVSSKHKISVRRPKPAGRRTGTAAEARVAASARQSTGRATGTIKEAAKRVAVDVALVAGALGKRAVTGGRQAASDALQKTGRAAARSTASALRAVGTRVEALANAKKQKVE